MSSTLSAGSSESSTPTDALTRPRLEVGAGSSALVTSNAGVVGSRFLRVSLPRKRSRSARGAIA